MATKLPESQSARGLAHFKTWRNWRSFWSAAVLCRFGCCALAAIYVEGGTKSELTLDLPKGNYKAEWVNTKTGQNDQTEEFTVRGGSKILVSPEYSEDVALRVVRR